MLVTSRQISKKGDASSEWLILARRCQMWVAFLCGNAKDVEKRGWQRPNMSIGVKGGPHTSRHRGFEKKLRKKYAPNTCFTVGLLLWLLRFLKHDHWWTLKLAKMHCNVNLGHLSHEIQCKGNWNMSFRFEYCEEKTRQFASFISSKDKQKLQFHEIFKNWDFSWNNNFYLLFKTVAWRFHEKSYITMDQNSIFSWNYNRFTV